MKSKFSLSRLFFAALILSLMSFASCKKCGYCHYDDGSYTYDSYSTCSNVSSASKTNYDDTRRQCENEPNGTWIED